MTLTEDTLSTTTLQLIRKRLADNVFKANPFAAWLLMNGRVKTEGGGKRIDEPLMYATNGTVKSYKGYDRLDVFPTEELTNAQYAWRQAAATISMSGLEDLQNSGPEKVFDMLKTKIKIADMSLRQWLAEKLMAATGTKDTTRDFLGLDEVVEDLAGASQGTLGGIDKQVETWWQNQFTDNTGTVWGASDTVLNEQLTAMYYDVNRGLTHADLILTSQRGFEGYENKNRHLLRLSDTRLLDVGFENLKFKGAVMMWDENIISGTATSTANANDDLFYFLNSEFISLTLHKRRNFVMTPFVTPYDQDAKVAQILLAGNMTANNNRFQGVAAMRKA